MAKEWSLKRTRQCDKCPWKVETNPYEIPDGYSLERHLRLGETAVPGDIRGSEQAMSCHEHRLEEQVFCVGWIHQQMGIGNNIRLRMLMLSCANAGDVQLDGEQYQSFEDTLPQ